MGRFKYWIATGFAASALVAAAAHAQTHRYRLDVAANLQSLAVEARFDRAVDRFRARAAGSTDLLTVQDCEGRPLSYRLTSGGRLRLDQPVRCLRYRAALRGVERGGMRGSGAVLSNVRQWFWLPAQSGQERVQVYLQLPAGMRASVPWQKRGEHFEFGPSPGSGDALALFGVFPQFQVAIPDGALQVAIAAEQVAATDLQVWQRWLQAAASDVAAVAGDFPNPDAQVLLVPGDEAGTRSPVPFGHVIRDMGEAVRFFVEPDRSLDDYLGDWTASHEFAHLLLPYVQDKWVSEGFASYYQNVLMMRRGAYAPQEMWQRLNHSFAQADAISEPPTLTRLGDAQFWRVRMLVYWSGAAIALLADAELRRRSDGLETLDRVLGRIAACCLPHPRGLSGEAFFALLDRNTRYPIFGGLYDQFAHAPGQPSVAALFAQMGIQPGAHTHPLRLDESAPLASLRRAIESGAAKD